LFEILRRKRKELAEGAGVPPYVIFSDKTLSEMAAKVPRTMEDLLRVNGIGKVKLEKYGAVFLELIRTHGGEPQKPPPGVAFSRY
jgi:ATP-dependent DNA helicase RecQ